MSASSESEDLKRIIESARHLGVEVDEEEALQWLTAMALTEADQVAVDSVHGIYGQRISMLDFSPQELAYFRAIGSIVEIPDRPGVETALSLSGSAAQSKIQSHPGDCDFFERVNIQAATREEACRIMAEILREKILSTASGPTYRFTQARFGSYPFAGKRSGQEIKKGGSVDWNIDEVQKAKIYVEDIHGQAVALDWSGVALDPGWTKLDLVVAHPPKRSLANASNNLDVTWEAPGGEIVPLDGQLDPYFQEVYLDAASIPLFTKLAKNVAADAMDEYVAQLEREVKKYTGGHPNYGKAAKRMYNVFRLSGRYPEAAYLRELFDEPATVLYQIAALIRTVDEASAPGSAIDPATISRQLDELIMQVVATLEGQKEAEIVQQLLGVRTRISSTEDVALREAEIQVAQEQVMEVVNRFFYERLTVVPAIEAYIVEIQSR